VAQAYPPLNDFWENWMDGNKTWLHNIVLGMLVFVCGLSFCLARAFMVVEAFINIRSLPIEAYDTPNWSQILLHF
jgi:dipeptide/tripeptide permease